MTSLRWKSQSAAATRTAVYASMQKNWAVVRRLIGYDRYHTQAALDQLNRLYPLVNRYMNFFQPLLQLQEKHRQGARVRRCMILPVLLTNDFWSKAS